ncbi:MAG: DUF255 domain-containing protein [Polyangiales bacterium]
MRPVTLSLALITACAAPRGLSAPGTPPAVDIALARTRRADAAPAWIPLRANVFARAAAEGRLVVFDGAANWCHWCHVMDETTWRDPAVLALLRGRFIAAREDVDSRPDLAARYAAWGWPATIILDAQGRELARYRGYLNPAQMLAALHAALRDPTPLPDVEPPAAQEVPLAERLADALDQMDRAYDPAQGSWGTNQKVALGDNLLVELLRAAQGDRDAAARARETLTRQRRIYDPVWGGVYQYSAGSTWDDPHFERLMSFQAATLRAALRAGAVLEDPAFVRDARALGHFLRDHLRDDAGAFHGSMDADVNAHDRDARFVDGHVYFALPDAARRRLGRPRVDPGAHPRDNGMAIEALVALHDATHEGAWLDAARRAGALMRARHVDAEGRVTREGTGDRLLADAAWLALGLASLAPHDPDAGAAAARIATRALDDFATPAGLRAVLPAEPLPGAPAGRRPAERQPRAAPRPRAPRGAARRRARVLRAGAASRAHPGPRALHGRGADHRPRPRGAARVRDRARRGGRGRGGDAHRDAHARGVGRLGGGGAARGGDTREPRLPHGADAAGHRRAPRGGGARRGRAGLAGALGDARGDAPVRHAAVGAVQRDDVCARGDGVRAAAAAAVTRRARRANPR